MSVMFQLGKFSATHGKSIAKIVGQFLAMEAMSQATEAGFRWISTEPPSPDMSSEQLSAGVQYTPSVGETPAALVSHATTALSILADQPGGTDALTNHLVESAPQWTPSEIAAFEALPDNIVEGLSDVALRDLADGGLDAAVAERIKRTSRRQDRSRVSKEPHEWRYCWQSNAINQIYDIAGIPKPDQLSHSYPAWVGSPQMRRVVQRVRLINRCLRSRNVKKVLSLFNLDEAALFALLRQAQEAKGATNLEMQAAAAVNEFGEILAKTSTTLRG